MPTSSQDFTITLTNTQQLVVIPIDYHIIKTITLQTLHDPGVSNDTWAQIGILSGGPDYVNVSSILGQAYTGTFNSVFWSGSIPVESDSYIFAALIGATNSRFRLTTILWKIVADEKGRFLADP